MANPLVVLGTLNRLVASVVWQAYPSLNVTASFLNRDGIRLALDGESVTFLRSMAGAVTSPEPYQMVTLTINLLKTQPLSALYQSQWQSNSLLGDGVVRPDIPVGTNGLQPYDLVNMAIESVREQSYAGEDAGWSVVCRGYVLINQDLWT